MIAIVVKIATTAIATLTVICLRRWTKRNMVAGETSQRYSFS